MSEIQPHEGVDPTNKASAEPREERTLKADQPRQDVIRLATTLDRGASSPASIGDTEWILEQLLLQGHEIDENLRTWMEALEGQLAHQAHQNTVLMGELAELRSQLDRRKWTHYPRQVLGLGMRALRCWRREGSYRTLRRGVGKFLRKLGLRKSGVEPTDSLLGSGDASGGLLPNPYAIPLDRAQSACILLRMKLLPRISIVVPVYKVARKWMDLCIRSVVAQHYPDWELILVDDHSRKPDLTALLNTWAQRDSRIRCLELSENQGIAGATNAGLKVASGQFVGFLDHDDELTPDALTWVVAKYNDHPKAEWFYSDEDKIDTEGKPRDPYHKPDYSSVWLLNCMYTCHFSVYSKKRLDQVGGIRLGVDGSQDHDLALRMSEVVPRENVVHIPRILYHWRIIPSSAASGVEAKPYSSDAGKKAVEDALARRNIRANVTTSKWCPNLYQIELRPKATPKVAIVIPTRNHVDDLRTCIDSVRSKTRYPDYDIIVIDNRSDEPALRTYLKEQQAEHGLHTVEYDKPFNHSAMHNEVIRTLDAEYVVFLNNDIEITSDNWLEQFVGTTELDSSIAGVGARLDYPDGTIQHAGLVYGLNGNVSHAHKHLDADHPGYYCRLISLGDFSGCSAAMLLLSREAFLEVGGFDQSTFPNSYNDADLWLRLQDAGYRCIFNPMVTAIHFESKSRVSRVDKIELRARKHFVERWSDRLANDPYYNRNLGLDNEHFLGFRSYPFEEDFPFLFRSERKVG